MFPGYCFIMPEVGGMFTPAPVVPSLSSKTCFYGHRVFGSRGRPEIYI